MSPNPNPRQCFFGGGVGHYRRQHLDLRNSTDTSMVGAFADRPQGKTLVLFDVDGTLTLARQVRLLAFYCDHRAVSDLRTCHCVVVNVSPTSRISRLRCSRLSLQCAKRSYWDSLAALISSRLRGSLTRRTASLVRLPPPTL